MGPLQTTWSDPDLVGTRERRVFACYAQLAFLLQRSDKNLVDAEPIHVNDLEAVLAPLNGVSF